jgi:hypothetical protein
LAWIALFALSACASNPPRAAVGRAGAALDAAEKAGAATDAPLALRKSRDQLKEAEEAMREERYPAARRAAEAAEVEAQLALAEATRARAQRELDEISRTVRALEEETRP